MRQLITIEDQISGKFGQIKAVPEEPETERKDCCGKCLAFHLEKGAKLGECRQVPPAVILDGNDHVWSMWPKVGAEDWCLEFTCKSYGPLRAQR